MHKLSIITINYNNKEGLEKTILSVINQSNKEFEFIIIDGASTDGSCDVIEKYKHQISYYTSEKDSGIYNAQNKGLRASKGEYLLFLNSGDVLCNNTVIGQIMPNLNEYNIVYGNIIFDKENGLTERNVLPDEITAEHMFVSTIWHPTAFIQRSLFEWYGLYDEQYKISGDFDFFCKVILKNKCSYKHINIDVCLFDTKGASLRKSNYDTVVKEKHAILKHYLSKEEYAACYQRALNELPFKYRFLSKVYRIPLIGPMIKNTLIALFPGDKK